LGEGHRTGEERCGEQYSLLHDFVGFTCFGFEVRLAWSVKSIGPGAQTYKHLAHISTFFC
jgi:hypothetical protein